MKSDKLQIPSTYLYFVSIYDIDKIPEILKGAIYMVQYSLIKGLVRAVIGGTYES